MKRIIFLISIIIFTFFSCKVSSSFRNQNYYHDQVINAEIGDVFSKSEPFETLNYHLNEDTLYLKISFRGKDKKHTFRFIGSPAISKSLPPIRPVRLIHNSNGDSLEKTIYLTLKIYLKPLAYNSTFPSELYLQSDDWNEKILYKPSNK